MKYLVVEKYTVLETGQEDLLNAKKWETIEEAEADVRDREHKYFAKEYNCVRDSEGRVFMVNEDIQKAIEVAILPFDVKIN